MMINVISAMLPMVCYTFTRCIPTTGIFWGHDRVSIQYVAVSCMSDCAILWPVSSATRREWEKAVARGWKDEEPNKALRYS